jgi:hypothetical protein
MASYSDANSLILINEIHSLTDDCGLVLRDVITLPDMFGIPPLMMGEACGMLSGHTTEAAWALW